MLIPSKGPFINDVTLILTFSNPPPPSVTFHHKNANPPKKMSQIVTMVSYVQNRAKLSDYCQTSDIWDN